MLFFIVVFVLIPLTILTHINKKHRRAIKESERKYKERLKFLKELKQYGKEAKENSEGN